MKTINDLDNHLLLLIFGRLSIQDLLTVGRIFVWWKEIRAKSALARKQLILLNGYDVQHCIDESVLHIPERRELVHEDGERLFPDDDQSDVQLKVHSFSLEFSRFLAANFYSLTTLTISTRVTPEEFNSISHLLEQFNRPKGTLHSLKLYGSNKPDLSQNIWPYLRLLGAVNSIGSLRKLLLDVTVSNWRFPRIDLPMMAHLEEFEFNGSEGDELDCLFDSIEEHAEYNDKLRRFGINFPTSDFSWLLRLRPKFVTVFTHLYLNLTDDNHDHFENRCHRFTQLTSLEITFKLDFTFPFFELFRPLTHVPNLLSLIVNIPGTAHSPLELNERGLGIGNFELASVKVLTINTTGSVECHEIYHECNMIRLLPSVQVLRIICEE